MQPELYSTSSNLISGTVSLKLGLGRKPPKALVPSVLNDLGLPMPPFLEVEEELRSRSSCRWFTLPSSPAVAALLPPTSDFSSSSSLLSSSRRPQLFTLFPSSLIPNVPIDSMAAVQPSLSLSVGVSPPEASAAAAGECKREFQLYRHMKEHRSTQPVSCHLRGAVPALNSADLLLLRCDP